MYLFSSLMVLFNVFIKPLRSAVRAYTLSLSLCLSTALYKSIDLPAELI